MHWRAGREEQELLRDNNEAIVVGAVGSGAPWFLTGWVEGTEMEFMIDTGCQVTLVFERMCAFDPRLRSRLRPCGRRLISADSSAVSVACSAIVSPWVGRTLPEHLEDIAAGSHPSLGGGGRTTLQSILHHYAHVFPAIWEPVTGSTTALQHEIEISDARLVWCGPRWLAPAGLWTEQTCIKEILEGGQIEPSDSPWTSPAILVTKKDGSTIFCVDYQPVEFFDGERCLPPSSY